MLMLMIMIKKLEQKAWRTMCSFKCQWFVPQTRNKASITRQKKITTVMSLFTIGTF